MKLFNKLFGNSSTDKLQEQEGFFQARFAPSFNHTCSPEQYDSQLLQIPLERIFLYKNKLDEIKAYEKDHLLFSKSTFDFRTSVSETVEDKDEFDLYCNYIEHRGIKHIILKDSKELAMSLTEVFKYEHFFNSLIHFSEVFGPNSSKAKNCYKSFISEVNSIYDWERFLQFKLSRGFHLQKREEYANSLMKRSNCTFEPHTKIGDEKERKFKPVREHHKDEIEFIYSKECLSIIIYKKDITKNLSGSIAYGFLDTYYYCQFGVVFITFKFLDTFKFTYYVNIKEDKGEEWCRSDSNKVEIWLLDRLTYTMRAWTRFELNAFPSIKRTAFISQNDSDKRDIDKNADVLLKEYSDKDFIKMSVFTERIYSDS